MSCHFYTNPSMFKFVQLLFISKKKKTMNNLFVYKEIFHGILMQIQLAYNLFYFVFQHIIIYKLYMEINQTEPCPVSKFSEQISSQRHPTRSVSLSS